MAIAKPAIQKVWSIDNPENCLDPGGVNATGIVASAKSIPRRVLNWVLQKIELQVRYLMARGISDWSADENYGIGDICQFYIEGQGIYTYRCWTPCTGADTAPPNDQYWIRWGYDSNDFAAYFTTLLGAAFPTLFSSAFGAQFPISANSLTAGGNNSEISSSVGTVSGAQKFEITKYSNSYGMCFLAFTVTDCGNPNGYVTITLSGNSRIVGPKAWISTVGDIKLTVAPKIYIMADNVIRVDWNDGSFVTGPHPTFQMFILGTPGARS